MLKQKARAVALGVLAGDLLLTALSLPLAYLLRQVVLTRLFPRIFPLPLQPFEQYFFLLTLILPIWGLLLYAAGFYRVTFSSSSKKMGSAGDFVNAWRDWD